SRSAKKAKKLPKKAVLILSNWLYRNCSNPYPNDLEKAKMMEETSLTRQQIDDWFINARRRSLLKIRQEKGLPPPRFKGGKKNVMPAPTLPFTSMVATVSMQVRSPPEVPSQHPEVQSQPSADEINPINCEDRMRRFQ
ncbi:homeobox TGIF2-like, partial [Pelobates cultripes]